MANTFVECILSFISSLGSLFNRLKDRSGLIAVLLAFYIGIKQMSISKEQTELTKWIFKVSSLRAEIESTDKSVLAAQEDLNKCLLELKEGNPSPERKKYLEEQIIDNDKTIREGKELFPLLEKSYLELLDQKKF